MTVLMGGWLRRRKNLQTSWREGSILCQVVSHCLSGSKTRASCDQRGTVMLLGTCQGHSHPLAPSTKSELLQQASGYTTPGNTPVGVLIH